MTPDQLKYWREVECATRRKVGGSVRHPDECPKLAIQGVEWAIPARGYTIRPKFGDGAVEVDGGDDLAWPEIQAYIDAADVRDEATCPECGQAVAAAIEASGEFIAAGFALVARALRVQYDLDNETLTKMLEFDGGMLPAWALELLAWASGGGRGQDAATED